MKPNQKATDSGIDAVVVGLVEEASDSFRILLGPWEMEKGNPPIDLDDRKWHYGSGPAKFSETKRIKLVKSIPTDLIPFQYVGSFIALKDFFKQVESNRIEWSERLTNSSDAFLRNYANRDLQAPALKEGLTAAQAVVDDFFDGYLSKADCEKVGGRNYAVNPPPPLVYFTEEFSPFTQKSFDSGAAIFDACLIGFPRYLAKGGVALWAALAHETRGHATLDSYPELMVGLRKKIQSALETGLKYSPRDKDQIIGYWMSRFEEAVSDCMGVLTMGPTLAFSMLARVPVEMKFIDNEASPVHPSRLLRCYLAAKMVGNLKFGAKREYEESILRFLTKIRESLDPDERQYWTLDLSMLGSNIQEEAALTSAGIFARTLTEFPMNRMAGAPSGKTLGDIQNWYDSDESLSNSLANRMTCPFSGFPEVWGECNEPSRPAIYPVHVVAAAALALAAQPKRVRLEVFKNMVYALNHIKPPNDYLSEMKSKSRA